MCYTVGANRQKNPKTKQWVNCFIYFQADDGKWEAASDGLDAYINTDVSQSNFLPACRKQ